MAKYNREIHKQIIVRKNTKDALDLVKGNPEKFGIKTVIPLTYNVIIKTMLINLYGSNADIIRLSK